MINKKRLPSFCTLEMYKTTQCKQNQDVPDFHHLIYFSIKTCPLEFLVSFTNLSL